MRLPHKRPPYPPDKHRKTTPSYPPTIITPDPYRCTTRYSPTTPSLKLYRKIAPRNNPGNGIRVHLFLDFYQTPVRPLDTTLITTIPGSARTAQNRPAVITQPLRQSVHLTLSSHAKRYVGISDPIASPAFRYIGPRHDLQPRTIPEREEIGPQARTRIMIHLIRRRMEIVHEKCPHTVQVFGKEGHVFQFHNLIRYMGPKPALFAPPATALPYSGRRFRRACVMVNSSAYSNSSPKPIPREITDTVTPVGCNFLVR